MDDKINGEYIQYHGIDQISEIFIYTNGKTNGEYKKYYQGSGKLYRIGTYIDDKKNGAEKTYWENDNYGKYVSIRMIK